MKKEVLTINVHCTHSQGVESGDLGAHMVFFEGTVDCPELRGVILPGGCDTQRREGDQVTLSARYMLHGTDRDGRECRVFVENNGAIDLADPGRPVETTPRIITDSPALRRLETSRLTGSIEDRGEDRLIIHIREEVDA